MLESIINKNMGIVSNTLFNRKSKCALVPFITAGYPNLSSTIDALHTLDINGADIIELGIPYADALADGPVIQESSRVALKQGVNVDQVISMLKVVIPCLNTPIVIFTYYNPVLAKGIESFVYDSAMSGVSGLVIPDLPLEEADYLISLCSRYSIELILFVAPTSSETRIASIISKSPGCLYLVSSCGVTGIRNQITAKINLIADKIKNQTSKAVILGFGISNSEQISQILKWNIDGVVIGSFFIKTMFNKSSLNAVRSLGSLCANFRDTIDQYISLTE
uniref:tryptophan synthase alpha subunit n=1 Tax=Catenella fusiformis TaxID=3024791 RepID=UPI0027DA4DC5|nr:tryptophan synthase alpha subunit [Catenella fusiformis]WCH57469.1 tryptophan synthase alpha subunit [Catenella fusiformis]